VNTLWLLLAATETEEPPSMCPDLHHASRITRLYKFAIPLPHPPSTLAQSCPLTVIPSQSCARSPGVCHAWLRQDYTLEEILDDEDILQECKNQNKRLMD